MRKFEYKYNINEKKRTVVALSSFAGRTVRGVAHCDPEDTWDVVAGKKLAAARCSVRVAEKRMKRSEDCIVLAKANLELALKYAKDMAVYHDEATKAYAEAVAYLDQVVSSM